MTRKASEDRGGVDRAAMRRSPQRILAEVSATLASSLAAEDILATVARQIGEAMGVFSCDIWEYEPTSRRMTFVVTWCAAQENPYGGSVGETVALDDWESMLPVVEGRETVELHRDDADLPPRDRVSFEKWGFQTTIDAPLVYDDRVIGVLGLVETREPRRFTPVSADSAGSSPCRRRSPSTTPAPCAAWRSRTASCRPCTRSAPPSPRRSSSRRRST